MKNELKSQIAEALNIYLEQYKMTASDFAKKSGVNQSYISQIRQGKFTTMAGGTEVEIAQKYFERIAKIIGYQVERSFWSTVLTPQFAHVLATLEDARSFGETNLIIGGTGSGKTYTAQIFAQQHPVDVFMITVGSTDNIGDLIDKITDALHIATPARTKSKKIRQIINAFRDIRHGGNRPMLILDEAEYMKIPALCSMKELYDNLHGVASIVLVGTDQLTRNIEKMRKKNKDGIPQLYRRIKFGIRELPPVDRSFKEFLNGLEPGLQRFIKTNCDNYGELHDVLVPTFREAERLGQEPNESLVKTVLGIRN
jgi:DNA transposition AAA+ family ATPase